MPVSRILSLQRKAGNRAVQTAVGTPAARSLVTIRASDLDSAFGRGGAVAASFDRGTFAAIRRTLSTYQRLRNPGEQLNMLQTLSKLVSQWMVEHKGMSAQDMARRGILEQLEDQIARESLRLGKGAADDKYLENVNSSVLLGNGDKHALKAMTQDAKNRIWEPLQMRAGRNLGLTDAEITAIQIFTGNDFGYINPATKADDQWYEDNKTRERTKAAFSEGATDKVTKAEGRLHAGMAIKALQKLPAYTSDVFRGLAFTPAEFRREMQVGGAYKISAIASASKSRKTAESFAGTSNKGVAVVLIMHNAGGREIQKISLASNESEVTLMPRSYEVQSINKIPIFPNAEDYVTACYEVHVSG